MSAGNGEQEGSKQAVPDGLESWTAYWTARGMRWRTEPEIDEVRQQYLAARRAVTPDIAQGSYPFQGITLGRADIEWLLATHQSCGVVGPVDWQVEQGKAPDQRRRGLDLRGADVRGQDLRALPLAGLQGGLHRDLDGVLAESEGVTLYQLRTAALHAEGVNLSEAHLDGACLDGAYCEEALLRRASFQAASLSETHLEWASLRSAHLEGANLSRARLDGASLNEAHLDGANLSSAHLENALLNFAHLTGANLRGAFLSSGTDVAGVHLTSAEHGTALLADIRWGEVNLGAMPWGVVRELGDDQLARGARTRRGSGGLTTEQSAHPSRRDRAKRLAAYDLAVRANRQLAAALRSQGLNEHADRFAYRAQALQRVVLRRQRHVLRWLGSVFLWLIAGYGYKPLRSVLTYLVVVAGFAVAYFALTNAALTPWLPTSSQSSSLAWYEAIVLSVSSFHGRGLFPTGLSLGDPVTILAAGEAVVGLLIEITFIATFTQRFFAR